MKQTLSEMTAVGSIGVNMAGPTEKDEEEKEDDITKLLKKIRSKRARTK